MHRFKNIIMKKNMRLFLMECFFCGLFTFVGSIIGHAFGQSTLFAGAVIGGISGIILTACFLSKTSIIKKNRLALIISCGILTFLLAAFLAVTNLSSPIIPLLSILLVGMGCVFGNNYILRKEQKKANIFALIGLLLILPASYFIIGSIVKYNLGFNTSFTLLDWFQGNPARNEYFNRLSPFVFLGGIFLSLLLNISIQIRIQHKGLFYSSMATNFQKVNFLIAGVSGLLLLTLMFYLLLENGFII